MLEMNVKIEVPDLTAAIHKLAEAITGSNTAAVAVSASVAAPAPAAPVTPAPVPVSAPVPPTTPQMGGFVAATSTPTTSHSEASAAAPATVPTTAPTYNLDQIARAGASLVDAGKMEQLLALLGKYGVAAVTQLQPEQFGAFATELRALGAQI